MASMLKQLRSSFTVTPHKVSVCILIQIYATPGPFFLPEPFSSVSHHNSFALFLLALIKSYDDVLEPKLQELMSQLREIGGLLDQRLSHRLSSLSSPDELFNLFSELQGTLGGQDSSAFEDQISLDPSSNLGMFLRRCLLTFSVLSFEGVCHLLSDLESYCKEVLSTSPSFDLTRLDGFNDETVRSLEYENMDLDNFPTHKATEEAGSSKRVGRGISFHMHVPKVLDELVQGVEVSVKRGAKAREASPYLLADIEALDTLDDNVGIFLRANGQIHGYLLQQADEIEKHGSSFPLNALESVLKQLQKLAPELHRVHFLRYLNMLHHDDYSGALENLHRYFDHSAGMEGFDLCSSSTDGNCFGKYEIALLCCGMMHVHFGHPKLALEALTEAVRASQQHSNDACLAYTLTVICNLLSEFGITSASRILGSPYSPMTSIGSSLSVHQQLYVLLKRALARSEGLKLAPLISANHLAMAKFDLMHVQRSMLSFGPKASVTLRTRPGDVCQKLRLSSHVVSEISNESSAISSVSRDGDFATLWLKNPLKPMGPLTINSEGGSGNECNPFDFCAQPCSVPKSLLQQLGSSYLVRTTAWEMFGSNSLARINALVYATCFADASSLDNLALACVKLVQHLASYKGYKEAYVAFRIVEEKFHVMSKSRVSLLKLQLLHEHALHRGRLKLAQQVCDELTALASPVTGVDLDLKTEASLRQARTLLAANQFNQAEQIAQSLFCTCYKFNLQIENATVLLLLAEIHKKAGNATLGLPYALASILFCQSFNLDLLKASATLTLAELWLMFGPSEAQRALSLLHGIFPMILGNGGLELRARAHIIEAKCHLSDASYLVSKAPEVVLDPLKEACEELELLEYHELAAEGYYLKSMVYDKLGYIQDRDIAAASFKDHIIALRNPQHTEGDILNTI